MKTIGLIGGMSWESTIPYYRQINQRIKQQLGALHSGKIILYSVDFAEIEQLQRSGDWDKAGEVLADAALKLQAAGAECIVLCTNTMHKVAARIEAAVTIPLLHIADATAEAIEQAGLKKVALLGTRFTMEQDFYKKRLTELYALEVLVPDDEGRALVHQVIYQELCLGVVNPNSRLQYQQIMADLVTQGAEAIILGCTEIGLLVSSEDCAVPLFDTTAIHAQKAADWALSRTFLKPQHC
ncbi:MAG: aspartate/glutamate racemase family protein [Gammaproteobacteria bacterium]|nr:aspartate/glutamate racemase family protein [Gammaproteobacteria bacterium]MBU2058512.1 aspartate/glutamate racemase family protein [Gammaproteobacteria bacterium]MBU2175537.1 aspartate/glutamate racemase family protein [Gammaproteobacteria bacterium]MBU2248623.1 aspartate/glutamate racemase family protein [Gammaproteobacteria bacterium]MBU2343089.1 aspartate/glutamate racemase family protein [Gammaproteobacteria bacterium]